MDKQRLLKGIQKYIDSCEGPYGLWFAGVSSGKDFFHEHGVNEAEDRWIGGPAKDAYHAAQVLEGLRRLGVNSPERVMFKEDLRFVYVYQKNEHTVP